MQKRNRKGFTLAELLIVVAIIAVLVAIAVPLFVGALDDAEDKVKQANERSVKGVAVSYILEHEDKFLDGTTKKLAGPWDVTATVGKDGEVSIVSILDNKKKGVKAEGASDITATEKTADGYNVKTTVDITDLSKLKDEVGGGIGG